MLRVGRLAQLTLAIICAALAAAPPSASDAAPPKQFFGIGGLEYYETQEFERMASSGVSTYRALFCWACTERERGQRDWSGFDFLVEQSSRARVAVLPLVLGVPRWMHRNSNRPPIYTPSQRQSWARFLTDAARRYGSGGTYWQAHPGLPRFPIRHWQIWNEPNLRFYWGGKPNPRRYAALLGLSRKALRRGDPRARVVHAGLFPRPRRGYGIRAVTFLSRLYAVKGAKQRYQVMALNPLSVRPKQLLKRVVAVRRFMRRHRDRTPIWITEFGWTTGGSGWRRSPYRATLHGQATKLRMTYRLLLKNRRALGLGRAFWLTWRDGPRPGHWLTQLGLVHPGGKAKPALRAYARLAGRA